MPNEIHTHEKRPTKETSTASGAQNTSQETYTHEKRPIKETFTASGAVYRLTRACDRVVENIDCHGSELIASRYGSELAAVRHGSELVAAHHSSESGTARAGELVENNAHTNNGHGKDFAPQVQSKRKSAFAF